MLIFIVIYVVITITVGVLASRLVHTTEDYLLAGRKLPFYLVTATLFATWFGSETILGSSSEFVKGGIPAVIRDPFGAALCLLIVGIFYAPRIYDLKILTLGDYFKIRFGRRAELLASVCMLFLYLSWIAAQMVAFGVIASYIVNIPKDLGIVVGAAIVTLYTFIGGMWSVSVTDFIQLIFILVGLGFVAVEIFEITDFALLYSMLPEGYLDFSPEGSITGVTNYLAEWFTIGLGAVASQDIFQRVMSAKSKKIAIRSSLTAGMMYLSVALIPLLLSMTSIQLLPDYVVGGGDFQMIIPQLVGQYTTPFTQVLFFGALLSAVLSTASSAILAPAAILGENIMKPLFSNKSDKFVLNLSRFSVFVISCVSLIIALRGGNIYELVGEASSVGLVSLFVPLSFGLFIKKSNTLGALLSTLLGISSWLFFDLINTEVNPIIYGFLFSLIGMMAGISIGFINQQKKAK